MPFPATVLVDVKIGVPLHVALSGPNRENVMVPVGFWPWPRVATSKMARPAGKPPADAWVASWGVAARAAPGATMAVPTATAAARARVNPGRGRRRLLGPGPGMPAGPSGTAAMRYSPTLEFRPPSGNSNQRHRFQPGLAGHGHP